jgi:homoserine kinase type II
MTDRSGDPGELRLGARLAIDWGLDGATITRNRGGMNSATWQVARGGRRWIAKAVRRDSHPTFAAGLAVAARVEAAGVPAGAPLPTRDGRLAIDVGPLALAVLTYVPGEELAMGGAGHQELIGSTLGRVHASLAGDAPPGAERFHWLDPQARHLDRQPWLRPALEGALDAWAMLEPGSLTWGLLHSDPAPEAFRFDRATASVGLIDWDRALFGPLLYDLASAVMYVGGLASAEGLVASYLQQDGPLGPAEIERGLAAMLRFRWAVQADYFAGRIAQTDLTGIARPEENDEGLEDARLALEHFMASDVPQ